MDGPSRMIAAVQQTPMSFSVARIHDVPLDHVSSTLDQSQGTVIMKKRGRNRGSKRQRDALRLVD